MEKLDQAKESVHAFGPWEESHNKLVEQLGEPAKVENDLYQWSAKDGESCKILKVQKMGEAVGAVEITTGACP